MGTWNDTAELAENSLLPEGPQTLVILDVEVRVNEWTAREEAVLTLEASDGTIGTETIPLEPWDKLDRKKVELFERIVKTYATGLGFNPDSDRSVEDIASDELPEHLRRLTGASVRARVTHVPSSTTKQDGTPFINHRVRFRGLMAVPQAQPAGHYVGAVA